MQYLYQQHNLQNFLNSKHGSSRKISMNSKGINTMKHKVFIATRPHICSATEPDLIPEGQLNLHKGSSHKKKRFGDQ